MEGVIRLVPCGVNGGATNMAADEALVRSAAEGIASLRFYGWTSATVSLGYFQPAAARLADARLASLPFVRRPSGGATLVHHHELTYCLALPPGEWQTGEPWMRRMHRIITRALGELGVGVDAVPPQGMKDDAKSILCFLQHTSGDLTSLGTKVVGSAQRKYHQALMQHGSILLRQSEFAPQLPGLLETAGVAVGVDALASAIAAAFVEDTGWRLVAGDWSAQECGWIDELVATKYATAAWNEKR